VIVAVPDFPSIVAVAVVVPGATAVTSPVVDTVAIAALAMDQLVVRPLNVFPFPSFGVAVSCWVAPTVSDGDAGVTSTVATAAGAGGVGVVGVVGVLGVVSVPPPPHADARTSSGSSKTCQRMERMGIIGRERDTRNCGVPSHPASKRVRLRRYRSPPPRAVRSCHRARG